jgi:translocator protein
MQIKKPIILLAFIVLCEAAGLIGTVFTINSIPTWYAALIKPSFNPPAWLFAPVWTVLYLLMGVSAYLIYEKGIKNRDVRVALYIFAVQLVLNVLWTAAFFGLRSITLGLVAIILLWCAIAVATIAFYRIRRSAGWIMLPYILWVTIAMVLNYYLLILN